MLNNVLNIAHVMVVAYTFLFLLSADNLCFFLPSGYVGHLVRQTAKTCRPEAETAGKTDGFQKHWFNGIFWVKLCRFVLAKHVQKYASTVLKQSFSSFDSDLYCMSFFRT